MSLDFPGHTWLPHDGRRHAYPGAKRSDGDVVTLFCRLSVPVATYPLEGPEWLWPECDVCHVLVGECATRREWAARERRATLHAYGDRPPCREGYRRC
ncbi:zinc finger protein [Streptoalloteichus hindustanus]|uniref:Zinc-finger n=1 Tax=Streptoalloteichus hindustanus TaxID=2017 RepID=A0A1M4XPL1_STRHI|nr:zinc-finger [Streptoalloteichus hindustanus]